MLKEVGASGQIALGKRFAGRLFEMVVHPDERVELIPMALVPAGASATTAPAPAAAWRPPGGYAHSTAWAEENREALERYAAGIEHEGTAAEQLQQFLTDGEQH
ncbi:MAG: type II toxin-antitoxin system CcdA family antitoxin [Proteobacteria bacterium]|nr:type II toxin-antitoxin system CcdA family antitoxin [Pseudomonadota bacterium]